MQRVVDTNIVSFLVNTHTLAAAYEPHLIGYDLAVAVQTLGELYEGASAASWGPARWQRLEGILTPFAVFDADPHVAAWWAWVRVVRRPQPIGVADAWIAATALAYDLDLVTHNPADFAGIPGLRVITESP